ncbi:MAG: hypothetical protein F6K31_03145 [Symploca sp. SIO2G7]|nr:hypothetical protein [Symploca sp. SIO2G7]
MDYLEELEELEEQGGIEVSKTKPLTRPKKISLRKAAATQPPAKDKEYQEWYDSLPEAVKLKLGL